MTFHPGQSYDKTPYESGAIATTHPDRLCAIGRLFGMSPANVECRVFGQTGR